MTIGDTLTDPADPRPLPRLDVDAPTLRMTFGVNTSPLAGREGKYVTSRQIKARLEKEVLGNVSIEVRPAESGEAFEVRGRGELQLAVLIEQMRREGFELTASRPEVLLREVDGEVQEPYERITIDIPPDYIGEVQTAHRRPQGPPRADDDRRRRPRPDGVRPAGPRPDRLSRPAPDRHARHGAAPPDRRGLRAVGRRGHASHERRAGVATGPGTSNAYGLFNLEQRAELFIGAGRRGLRGHDRRRERRSGDMDVNPTKEKKLTNIRTHSHDESLRLTPPRPITLESALEFIAADELVEVTPVSIRLRKRALVAARPPARGRPGGRPAARRRARGRARRLARLVAPQRVEMFDGEPRDVRFLDALGPVARPFCGNNPVRLASVPAPSRAPTTSRKPKPAISQTIVSISIMSSSPIRRGRTGTSARWASGCPSGWTKRTASTTAMAIATTEMRTTARTRTVVI